MKKIEKSSRVFKIILMVGFIALAAYVIARPCSSCLKTSLRSCKITEDMLLERGSIMENRKPAVTFKGNPLTLSGSLPKLGDTVPDVKLLANDLSEVKLSDFRGKVCVICSVPSLDTSVCDTETRKFNEHAVSLGGDVVVLTVSMDLPFAQARWCGAAGVENVRTLSDHRDARFGNAFGLLIKELRLLARAVFVVDKEGVIRYIEVVEEMTNEPNYEAALKAVQQVKQ